MKTTSPQGTSAPPRQRFGRASTECRAGRPVNAGEAISDPRVYRVGAHAQCGRAILLTLFRISGADVVSRLVGSIVVVSGPCGADVASRRGGRGTMGTVARYFTERYGIPPEAIVVAGSGDNPQTKVLARGGLLSLGTSFVLMAEGCKPHRGANAMYDGLGRPFLFGCRTNGALAWEAVRLSHGLAADSFAAAESALASIPPGSVMRILQKERESFPESPPVDMGRREDFQGDYAGAVDSALGLVWLGSRRFAADSGDAIVSPSAGKRNALSVTGGAAASDETLKRIAAIWDCPVARIGEAGAAAGAAVSAAMALVPDAEKEESAAILADGVSGRGRLVQPDPLYVEAYHRKGGYLDRLASLLESGLHNGSVYGGS